MGEITFKYGALIRTGPKLVNGGKWNATLDEYVRNATTNADLTIYISVFFKKIDPATGNKGTHPDTDATQRKIQKWAPGEFERYTKRLVTEAARFWNGVFWLKTPDRYDGLDWPDTSPTHHCNIYCRFELEQVSTEAEGHYTIAVVRAEDSENFRSNSRLYSQKDINSESLIPNSTTKFWTHYHEVGHLLGLGHVGHDGVTNVHGDNSVSAYGVSKAEMQDVMGKGSVRHNWHALPWQEAAETFTGIAKADWKVHQHHIWPTPLKKK